MSSGNQRQRTTGRAIPELHSIHKGTIASVQAYGAFVRLGDGSEYKDGLLHISKLSASSRVDKVEDIVSQGDSVWVKVVDRSDEGKYSLDMRYVGQTDGEDKDPNNTLADTGGGGKGKGRGAPEPIRIGAIQATTCSRCGAIGHAARECWATNGVRYSLVEEPVSTSPPRNAGKPESGASTHSPELIKEALRLYLKRKAGGGSSSSSSYKKAKKEKKEKKAKKKAKKKEQKKLKKQLKKQLKKEKKAVKKAKAEKDVAEDSPPARQSQTAKESKVTREARTAETPGKVGEQERRLEEASDSSSSS